MAPAARLWLQLAFWSLFVTMATGTARAEEAPRALPKPALDASAPKTGLETAVLAGGCFWGQQGVFEHLKGVRKVVAGYSGGEKATATYDQVSTERTGHAESVEITFDPSELSYGQLLQVFFSVAHDPTELNRQGPDVGTSYRSEIFFADPEQARIARAYVAQLEAAHVFDQPIVTRIEPLSGFYPAEAEHQDYLIRHPNSLYIVINDLPKIGNLKRIYPELFNEKAAALSGTGA
ncbi:MAG: peptide-methionine (S)-S-oxide reductase MsrA, partial [Hyphomicrobiales bacterium]|nr:peptide-methionine (S)-S-oxide reductase MsrA [Hyphomicrobiales bacterium]